MPAPRSSGTSARTCRRRCSRRPAHGPTGCTAPPAHPSTRLGPSSGTAPTRGRTRCWRRCSRMPSARCEVSSSAVTARRRSGCPTRCVSCARLDPERGLPPVHLLDVLHLPNATTLRYNAARLRQLPEEVLPCWLGTGVSDSALATAMARRREVRRLLDGVEQLRRTDRPRLTGAQALRIHGATSVLPVQESLDLLSVLTADPAGLPDLAPMTRVFLTGSNHDHDGVYVRARGRGHRHRGRRSRQRHRRSTGTGRRPGLDDLAVALRDRGPAAPTSTMSRRAEATLEASSAAGATVVVSFIRSCDEAPSWDYPVQRTLLATRGIPAVLLDRQPYDPDPAALRELVGQARSGSGVLP